MDGHDDDMCHTTIRHLLPLFERQNWKSQSLVEIYHRTIIAIKTFENHVPMCNFAMTVSKQILMFDMKPDTWRRLQFAHIMYFPVTDCPSCHQPFCLQCGNQKHDGETCEEYMQAVVDRRCGTPEVIETFRWQLKNSRKCPNCSIMIHRDEGCNKVDCSFCGFCFCWACRSAWSEKCGFYHCAEALASDHKPSGPEISGTKTELGVPNVSSIQARLFPSINV
ncbi:hypothetical protein BX666DRAFT_1879471 [Dichotomocladium elegans]|nr:hypothetical protein BX666DRAFT_1879471 [Dichotomocladium elegans]